MTDVNMTQFTLDDEPEKNKLNNLPGDDLTKLEGVGKSLESKLKEKGFINFHQIAECTPQRLSRKIEGVGIKKAELLIISAKEFSKIDESKSISEKKKDGGLMFDPKYKIDRTSKSIPSQKELYAEKQMEYIPEEEGGEKGLEMEIKNGPQYDSFVVEPVVEDGYPTEDISDDPDDNELQDIIPNKLEDIQQAPPLEKTDESTVFDYEIEARIKNLVHTYIENEDEEEDLTSNVFNNQYEKAFMEKKLASELESDYHVKKKEIELENEIMSATKLNELIIQAKTQFQSKEYTILSHRIEGIDFLAVKLIHIEDELNMIALFPVIICNLKGSLIIANNKIEYYPVQKEYEGNAFVSEELYGHLGKALKKVQDHILWNISTERTLFHYLKKKYNRNLEIEKTKRGKKLFFRAGLTHYKISVNPIVLCKKDTEFNEKILPFPYQRESNIHFIQIKKLPNLLTFLEQKYHLIENRYHNENVVKTYFQAQNRFIANAKNYSIPFVGVLIGLLIIVWSVPLFSHIFFNLSLGIITVYSIILGYLCLNFYKKKEEITHEFATPYHKRSVNLDETDLEIIHEKVSLELMDQFIYECFGKDADFHVIAQIEAQKADTFQYHRDAEYENIFTEEESPEEFLFAKGKHDNTRKKNRPVGTNYHLFMED